MDTRDQGKKTGAGTGGAQQTEYVDSLYERALRFKYSSFKCVLYPVIILIVFLCIVLFLFQRPEWCSPAAPLYFKAAPILCTIIFWPFIIIDNSHRFYEAYRIIQTQVVADSRPGTYGQLLKWYRNSATHAYTFNSVPSISYVKYLWYVFFNFLLLGAICGFFVSDGSGTVGATVFLIIVMASAWFNAFMVKQRNLGVTLFTVCCGLAYFIFVYKFSNAALQMMFAVKWLNAASLVIIAIVFFIAGTAIYPMIGTLKAFYFDLPKVLDTIRINIKPSKLSTTLDSFKIIKKHFVYMACVSLIAYFQLFSIVYIMGILNKSVLTIILMALGSLFPLLMYCASDVMYRHLMHKQYIQYINQINIDKKINNAYKKDDLATVQQLFSLKEQLSVDFEEHMRPNIQLITALISPVITTVLSLIFPKA